MGRRGIFVAIFLISCAPNQIFSSTSSCNDQNESLQHSDSQNTLEEQSTYNAVPESPEDETQTTLVSKPQFEILPNNNFNPYSRLFLLPRKYLYKKPVQDKPRENLWASDNHQLHDKGKRSEKGMQTFDHQLVDLDQHLTNDITVFGRLIGFLDAPEYILNPNSGNGNGGRRVGGLMKSNG